MDTKAFDIKQNKTGSECRTKLNLEAALMCPKCFNIIRVAQLGYIDACNKVDGEYIDLIVTPRYHCECPSCHVQNEFIPVDILISRAVSTLNKAGYLTEMCCNSHGDIKDLFIKFKEDYTFKDLPVGFKKNGVFLRCWDTEMSRVEAISNLNEWVYQFNTGNVAGLLQVATGD